MKKTVLALCVLSAYCGAAAAADSGVQLYGIIDVGVSHFTGLAPKGGAAGQTVSSTGVSSGGWSPSRIGVKGQENLGGGLTAMFDVETGFCAAGLSQNEPVGYSGSGLSNGFCTGGGFMQRQSWVGVKGDFGTLTAGRQYGMALDNEYTADPFGYGMTGTIGNLSLAGAGGNYLLLRTDQTLQYDSPNLNGVTLGASYSFAPLDNGTVPTSTPGGSQVPRLWALNAQYASGPVVVGVNYSSINHETYGTDAAGVNSGKINLWQLYGTYDLNVAKLYAMYEKASGDYAYGTTSGAAAGDNKFWLLGVSVPAGSGAVMASYSETKADANSLLLPSSQYGTAKQVAVGYSYSMSRQTSLYASYAHISNDTHTAFAVGSSTDYFAGVAGQSSSGVMVGLRHSF